MASYNRIKTSKVSPIGTIMPWVGLSSSGKLPDNIPNGWMVCDGRGMRADQYPLLALTLGNTYGPVPDATTVGSVGIVNSYPNYDENDIFYLPNLSQKALIDLEGNLLSESDLNVVGQYITENGATSTPPTLIPAYVDINFSIEASNTLSGRISGITMNDPVYFETYYTIPRKLGIDHTPTHTHPRSSGTTSTVTYNSAEPDGRYIDVFGAGNADTASGNWTTATAVGSGDNESTADIISPGTYSVTYYDPDASSLVTTDQFRSFTSTQTAIPITVSRNIPSYANTSTYSDDGTGIANVQQTAVTGSIPVPGTYQGYKNYYGTFSNTVPTYATTLSHNAEDFASNSLTSHNHFTVDLTMTRGQLGISTTTLVNDVSTGTVAPVSVDKALNITVNPNTPAQTIIYIIRVY